MGGGRGLNFLKINQKKQPTRQKKTPETIQARTCDTAVKIIPPEQLLYMGNIPRKTQLTDQKKLTGGTSCKKNKKFYYSFIWKHDSLPQLIRF